MEHLQIQMLGGFSIRGGENQISDDDNRTRKNWLLLSYLICHHGRSVSQKKLIELLWGEDPASSNPENALRITFHRVRSMLNTLWPTAGHDLILHKDNGYAWNSPMGMTLDFEEFERLCQLKSDDPDAVLAARLEAADLYRGDFLEKQSSETWVIPISTHFHNLYICAGMEAAQLLSQRDRHGEAADLCRRMLSAEPYHEPLHQLLMRELAACGDRKAAAEVYEMLSKRLFDDFGIRPSDETRAIYREAAHSPDEKILPLEEVLEDIQEQNAASGAMLCDYDYFKILCHAESRSMERTGNATHVLLLSVSSGDKPLTKRSMNRIMEQLGEQIRTNLRRGDTYARCSVSQYIVMLPRANYENSCMVCRRLVGAFNRKHPHVTARIHYMVQPLTPTVCVP